MYKDLFDINTITSWTFHNHKPPVLWGIQIFLITYFSGLILQFVTQLRLHDRRHNHSGNYYLQNKLCGP
jgi:hypothetical protein